MVDSGLPVVVFVAVNALLGLRWASGAALATAAVVLGLRLARRERLQFAVSGVLGVGVAVFFAWRLRSAAGFFLPGIAINAAYFLAFAGSLLRRRPLVGLLWTYLSDGRADWRDRPALLRAYTRATWLWTAMYAAKVIVQGLLFLAERTGWLAVAKLAMGYPLFALVAAATVWLVRRGSAADAVVGAVRPVR